MIEDVASLKIQVMALEVAIEQKEQEIKEYQATIKLLLETIEKEAVCESD